MSAVQPGPVLDVEAVAAPDAVGAAKAFTRIVYVIERPLTASSAKRFGIETAQRFADVVDVIDLSDVIFPTWPNVRHDTDYLNGVEVAIVRPAEFPAAFEDRLRGADLVVFLAESNGVTRKNWAVCRALSRCPAPVLLWAGPKLPGWERNRFLHRLKGGIAARAAAFLTKDYLTSALVRLPSPWLGVREADYLIDSAPKIASMKNMVGASTRRLAGHAPDFDVFLEHEKAAGPVTQTAVFLDQFYPFHEDFKDSGTETFDPEAYYGDLNRFFTRLEAATGLEVVIAPHPRAEYERFPDLFEGRRICRAPTPRQVIESRLVLTHTSTAVGFAVMAGKPAALISSAAIDRTGIERLLMESIAAETGAPILDMDTVSDETLTGLPSFDDAKYDRYMERFIIPKDGARKPLWEKAFSAIAAGRPNTGRPLIDLPDLETD